MIRKPRREAEDESTPVTRTPINICLITDNAYAAFTAATLASILDNHSPSSTTVSVVAPTLSLENQEKLQATAHHFGGNVDIRVPDSSILSSFDRGWTHSYITASSFYKFYLADLLRDLNRVLYLDGDVIVLRDLSSLFGLEMGNSLVAAAQSYEQPEWALSLNSRFGLSPAHRYFNSGVLLLDLDALRHERIGEALATCAVERKTHDEVAFNVVMSDRYTLVHPRFNVGPHLCWFGEKLYLPGYYDFSLDAYRDAAADPAIVHFYGKSKPWHYNSIHPHKGEFYKYLSMTPYARTAPVDRNVRNVILRPAYWANFQLWRRRAISKMKLYAGIAQ